MTESRTLEELERMYSVEKRNVIAYRRVIEQAMKLCQEYSVKVRQPVYRESFYKIHEVLASGLAATGEFPRDGFKR